jgi:hypothetical protein
MPGREPTPAPESIHPVWASRANSRSGRAHACHKRRREHSAYLPPGLTLGGIVSAIFGVRVVLALSERRLTVVTATLLAALGLLLLVEAFIPFGNALLATEAVFIRALAGLLVGLNVGVVSSTLGVAGGELLIPALM